MQPRRAPRPMTTTLRPLLVGDHAQQWPALVAHARGARQVVLAVLLVGVAAGSFSNSLLVAALPQVADDLHTTTSVVS